MPGCQSAWCDVDLLKALPTQLAQQVHKRRRLHLETELRQELRREFQAEVAAAQRASSDGGELRQSLVNEALELLVDKCRRCGQGFFNFDGCFVITCDCQASICGYCLQSGSSFEIHRHIASNECDVRRQMFPDADDDTFHQGASKDEEFAMARRIRITNEMHEFFQALRPQERALLARRIRRDVEENGIAFELVSPTDEAEDRL